ncbi:putative sulfate exporter family transporter [uncultured Campylobacter sp.]|uniref:YeiH family protein n=1 Tax=uncultured Campylobacter sp. TaxID=218934 RepID=UPI002609511C|nr:putative sulfate exporter family transporter [uncultured Campylobacter sp.]
MLYFKGILLTFLLALFSIFFVKLDFIASFHISALIFAILFGLVFSFLYKAKASSLESGVSFSAKKLLRFGIILYAFNLSLTELSQVGFLGIFFAILLLTFTLVFGFFVAVKIFKLDKELAILISAGTAICGAAAVLALESALKTKSSKAFVAVSTVVVFGLLAMFIYPLFYGVFSFDEKQMGIFLGLSLHEVANVVGAGAFINENVANIALITKMIRVILLVPVLLILPLLLDKKMEKRKLHIPYFALVFLLLIFVNSFIALPSFVVELCKFLSLLFLAMSMCALGLQFDIAKFKESGKKAFGFALLLTLFVAFLAFVLALLF